MPASDAPLAEQVPQHEQREDQVHLPEADRDQDGIQQQRGQAQHEGESPGGGSAERGTDHPDRHDEEGDERGHVAERPDRLDGLHRCEHAFPGRKEQRRKRRIGEQEAGVRESEGVQVVREDVPAAQPEVDAEVDLVGVDRHVEAIGQGRREGDDRRSPAGDPAQAGSGAGDPGALCDRVVERGHGRSPGPSGSAPAALGPSGPGVAGGTGPGYRRPMGSGRPACHREASSTAMREGFRKWRSRSTFSG